jgi:hypothetical protein
MNNIVEAPTIYRDKKSALEKLRELKDIYRIEGKKIDQKKIQEILDEYEIISNEEILEIFVDIDILPDNIEKIENKEISNNIVFTGSISISATFPKINLQKKLKILKSKIKKDAY